MVRLARRAALGAVLGIVGAATVPASAPAIRAGAFIRIAAATSPAQAARPGRPVTLFGAAGTFGTYAAGGSLPTGEAAATRAVPGWAFPPGTALYSLTVTADGTVVLPAEPQTDNQTEPTAAVMAVSTFDPARRALATSVIPTTSGAMAATDPTTAPAGAVGGADVSAVEASGDSVAFVSAVPYHGWNVASGGLYPSFGRLTRSAAGWVYDPASGRTAADLEESVPAGDVDPCRRLANRFAQAVTDCRGPAAMASLPASGDLVVGLYFGDGTARDPNGALMVLDGAGRVVAAFVFPPIGGAISAHPRTVVADPVGRRGDERFAVVFDVFGAGGRQLPSTVQEFTFNAASIAALSSPVLSGDRDASGVVGAESAAYGPSGELWVAQAHSGTLSGADLVRYGSLADRCPAGGGWASACAPDDRVPDAAALGLTRSLTIDPMTGSVFAATLSGRLLVVAPGKRARVVDLGLDALVDRTSRWIGPRGGAIDPATRSLWLPIQQLRTPANCAAAPCHPEALDQWLMQIPVDSVPS